MFDVLGVLWDAVVDWSRGESFWRSLLIGLAALVVFAAIVLVIWRRF